MSFLSALCENLDQYHLLKHPFYQSWNSGTLSQGVLQVYASEYYHHVAAFPRYISAIHSRCADLAQRQVLLANLVEEEQGEENHPELWLRFAEGLGCSRLGISASPQVSSTKALVDGYFEMTGTSYAKGLGALFAYERQTPQVAQSKIEGLRAFYGIHEERALQFFQVHKEADEWHAQECAGLLEALNPAEQKEAQEGAIAGAKLLWGFLDGMCEMESLT
ncbi:MAG: CADD family putative folate metabolism protein [Oligoflexales bacterium]|nr:CADD family putative folate metabolism protein [Oligoflexales bacterium]